mmetsp:Transcript_21926/g.47860  ORF Transcript_21926/g.47860 Transcript_21926/m.47860 type:complete len:520 (-) Transcript_21926:1857-3416(-)|eukprot:CAMPEP_0202899414 /NCGR_PEP_ID=MMETSP1392-20130828/7653_1 /ASSEMBLY_ACC=CAM_ASM_000868 /TAXON_ID=225041 /ORGANISM="Chlamydomonas chlamydogama, Strain SAG 11-48b" /LENGTH=519 /DNA_ID=CAMNT_0049585589 /DNA_START=276 /DNA_END=1835 /DNA_ORIENTATION=+
MRKGAAAEGSSGSVEDSDDPRLLEQLAGTTAGDWTPAEQAKLDDALNKFPSDKFSTLSERYIHVAAHVPSRSARDIALRLKWLSLQQRDTSKKRGKATEDSTTKRRGSAAPVASSAGTTTRAAAAAAAAAAETPQSHEGTPQSQDTPEPEPLHIFSAPDSPSLPDSSLLLPQHPSLHDTDPLSLPPLGLLPSIGSLPSSLPCSSISGDELSVSAGAPPPQGSGTSGATSGGTAAAGEASDIMLPHNLHMPLTMPPMVPPAAMAGAAASMGMPGMAPPGPPAPPLNDEAALVAVQNLMEQNYAILNTFKANMQQCKVVENTDLLVRYRDNMMACLSHMSGMGGIMSQMPQLPVQPNMDLASKFLPPKPGMPMPPLGMPGLPLPPFPLLPPGMAPPGMPPLMGPHMPSMPGPPGMAPLPMPPPQPGMLPPMPFGLPIPMPGPMPTADGSMMPGAPRPMGMPMPGAPAPAAPMPSAVAAAQAAAPASGMSLSRAGSMQQPAPPAPAPAAPGTQQPAIKQEQQ